MLLLLYMQLKQGGNLLQSTLTDYYYYYYCCCWLKGEKEKRGGWSRCAQPFCIFKWRNIGLWGKMNSKHFMLTVAMLVGVLSLLITSISAPFFYWKNNMSLSSLNIIIKLTILAWYSKSNLRWNIWVHYITILHEYLQLSMNKNVTFKKVLDCLVFLQN